MFSVSEIGRSLYNLAIKAWGLLQLILVALIFIIIISFSCYFVNHLITVSNYDSHPFKILIYFWLGVIILYNLVFNYVTCNRMGPGHPSQLQQAFSDFSQKIQKRCKRCHGRKPVRSHHCSVCQSCNLQMDHHCPWMGTCIGHYNRQYFINFLTYVTLVATLYVIMMIDFKMKKTETYYFMISISIVIGLFTFFHWVAALLGRTTLQLCDIMDGYQPSSSISTNFLIIYGTTNIIKALAPLHRQLYYKGYEWQPAEEGSTLMETNNTDYNFSQQISS